MAGVPTNDDGSLVEPYSRSALDLAIAMMRRFQQPWGIAGGWGIELFLNKRLRPHADVDVAVLRVDQQNLWTDLEPDTAHVVIQGTLHPWDAGEWIPAPIHEVHLGWSDGSRLEILLNEQDEAGDEWIYRRDNRVRREMSRVFTIHAGVQCLGPEIVLLYKSKAPRTHDEMDFIAALPMLSQDQRAWLQKALVTSAPGLPWIESIMRTSRSVGA